MDGWMDGWREKKREKLLLHLCAIEKFSAVTFNLPNCF